MSPTIALLTDFGVADHYVGVMKAVIHRISPGTTVVDITHEVTPQNIDQGAYLLWTSYSYFPQGTIFVCVVDPGVGSKRHILCVTTNHYTFLAPDNGLLKYVLGDNKHRTVIAVTAKKYFLPLIDNTFHGRDIFAPVGAHLANGLNPAKLGRNVHPATPSARFVRLTSSRKSFEGFVVHIDRFGNIITSIRSDNTYFLRKYSLRIVPGGAIVSHSSRTYADAPPKLPFLIVGSSGLIEVSVKNGNAAKLLRARLHDSVKLSLKNV